MSDMPRHRVRKGDASCARFTECVAAAGMVANTLNELYILGYTEHEIHPLPTPSAQGAWFGSMRYLIVAWRPQESVQFDPEV